MFERGACRVCAFVYDMCVCIVMCIRNSMLYVWIYVCTCVCRVYVFVLLYARCSAVQCSLVCCLLSKGLGASKMVFRGEFAKSAIRDFAWSAAGALWWGRQSKGETFGGWDRSFSESFCVSWLFEELQSVGDMHSSCSREVEWLIVEIE